jgi:hypothetical protein
MKNKPILLGLSFLIAASMACSFGARKTAPAPVPASTEITVSTEIPTQASTPAVPVSQGVPIPTLPAGLPQVGEIRQWAASATASTEYGNPDWAASQATGAPNVTACSDNTSAWASIDGSTVQWLELTYATPVKPYEINIYQSYNPGQIVKVELFSSTGQTSYLAYTTAPVKIETCPQKLTLFLDGSNLNPISRIRITVDQTVLGVGWAEIDAVELVGVK